MSLGKDIQRAETKIAAMEKRIAEDDVIKSDLVAKVAELEKAKEEAGIAMQAEIEKLKQNSQATLEAAIAKQTEAEARVAALTKEIADAQAKLANPAFTDASAKGEKEAVEATNPPADAPKKSLFEEYQAIEDPSARTRFWNDHEKELRAEAQAAFNK